MAQIADTPEGRALSLSLKIINNAINSCIEERGGTEAGLTYELLGAQLNAFRSAKKTLLTTMAAEGLEFDDDIED